MQEKRYSVNEQDTLLPFLLAHVTGKSRNSVKSLLTRGQVQVDGKTVTRHDHPLLPGQTVVVLPQGAGDKKAPFPILYEDGRLLVIEKPAGLLSMATDKEKVRTAYHMATDYVRKADPQNRIFIVHRLDRATSGVLLFAKDEETKRAFQDNWDKLVGRRGYLAVVEGRPPKDSDTIRTLLRENAAHKVYSVRYGGKEAITHYTMVSAERNTPFWRSIWTPAGKTRSGPTSASWAVRWPETGTTERPPILWGGCASMPMSWYSPTLSPARSASSVRRPPPGSGS